MDFTQTPVKPKKNGGGTLYFTPAMSQEIYHG